ncbi:MAG TPA: hypothetical protein VMY79_01220 [Dehalococcoidia bacterium]|nr:hypothetical protein [Dehalococcoidia bacterium]
MALEGIVPIIVFPDKATVWVLALVYDEDKKLVDPTAIKVSITDPSGEVIIVEEAMTKYESTEGIYEYFYHAGVESEPMDKGQWKGEVLVIDGTEETAVISPINFAFSVK